jgi:hypothetical protein
MFPGLGLDALCQVLGCSRLAAAATVLRVGQQAITAAVTTETEAEEDTGPAVVATEVKKSTLDDNTTVKNMRVVGYAGRKTLAAAKLTSKAKPTLPDDRSTWTRAPVEIRTNGWEVGDDGAEFRSGNWTWRLEFALAWSR